MFVLLVGMQLNPRDEAGCTEESRNIHASA